METCFYFQCAMFGNGNVLPGSWFPFPGFVRFGNGEADDCCHCPCINSTHVEPYLPSLHKLEMCLRRLVGLPLSFVWTGAGWYSIFGNGNLFLFSVCDVWKRKHVSWKLVSVSRVCYVWKRKRVSWKLSVTRASHLCPWFISTI